jgi:hypothetical protein
MELNHYAVEVLARDQLAERRQAAARHTLARAARPRAVIRVAVGRALIRLGTRTLGRGLAPADLRVVDPRRTG